MTSGFNIGWHISTKEEFNQMLGFSTEDVYAMFNYYKEKEDIPADRDINAIVNEMKPCNAPRVEALRQGTQLHKIIMQFDGYKLLKMDEVK